MTQDTSFRKQADLKESVDETSSFAPKFGADGLMPVVATDHKTREILMLAYMNEEALAKTIETREGWYWSRSRQEFWRKGATSGHTQRVLEIRIDCDQDAIELVVEQAGAACHTGRRSCFYRVIDTSEGEPVLKFEDDTR